MNNFNWWALLQSWPIGGARQFKGHTYKLVGRFLRLFWKSVCQISWWKKKKAFFVLCKYRKKTGDYDSHQPLQLIWTLSAPDSRLGWTSAGVKVTLCTLCLAFGVWRSLLYVCFLARVSFSSCFVLVYVFIHTLSVLASVFASIP